MKLPLRSALGAVLISAVGCADPFHNPGLQPTSAPLNHSARSEPAAAPHPSLPDAMQALTVSDAIRIAIANSPSLRSAGYRVEAAAGRVRQAGLHPNPSLVFGGEGLGSNAGGGGETILHLEQEIVLGGKLDKARAVARAEQHTAEAEVMAQEFALASDVSRAYVAVATAEAMLQYRRELAELATQLAGAVDDTVSAGAATEPDRLRALVVRDQAEVELEAAQLQVGAARRALVLTMGLDQPLDLPLTSPLDTLPQLPAREQLFAAALKANAHLNIARLNVERARRAHDLARANAVPDLFATVGPRYSDPDSETTMDIGVGIEIPLFDRHQGEISATLAERLSAGQDVRAAQLRLLAELDQAYSSYESARLAATRFRDRILPGAQRTLDLRREAYQRGKSDYLHLLDAQQVFINSRLTYVDALRRLHDAAALLNELAQLDAEWREAPSTESTTKEARP